MQSRTEDFIADLETYDIRKNRPKSFDLYEEYSQKNIEETIRIRRDNFDEADPDARRELEAQVYDEVERFRVWLEETKNLEPTDAHYYSVSLKSLLLRLPIDVQIAWFFDIILNTHPSTAHVP